jgi:hypothetical protein
MLEFLRGPCGLDAQRREWLQISRTRDRALLRLGIPGGALGLFGSATRSEHSWGKAVAEQSTAAISNHRIALKATKFAPTY